MSNTNHGLLCFISLLFRLYVYLKYTIVELVTLYQFIRLCQVTFEHFNADKKVMQLFVIQSFKAQFVDFSMFSHSKFLAYVSQLLLWQCLVLIMSYCIFIIISCRLQTYCHINLISSQWKATIKRFLTVNHASKYNNYETN